jgi:hypothetical protein
VAARSAQRFFVGVDADKARAGKRLGHEDRGVAVAAADVRGLAPGAYRRKFQMPKP